MFQEGKVFENGKQNREKLIDCSEYKSVNMASEDKKECAICIDCVIRDILDIIIEDTDIKN